MSVHELSHDQLDELRWAYFWSNECQANFPGDVPDSTIFDYFSGITFVQDDFCCTAGMEG